MRARVEAARRINLPIGGARLGDGSGSDDLEVGFLHVLTATTVLVTSWNLNALFLLDFKAGTHTNLMAGRPLRGNTARVDIDSDPHDTVLSNPLGIAVWQNPLTGEEQIHVMDNQHHRIQC